VGRSDGCWLCWWWWWWWSRVLGFGFRAPLGLGWRAERALLGGLGLLLLLWCVCVCVRCGVGLYWWFGLWLAVSVWASGRSWWWALARDVGGHRHQYEVVSSNIPDFETAGIASRCANFGGGERGLGSERQATVRVLRDRRPSCKVRCDKSWVGRSVGLGPSWLECLNPNFGLWRSRQKVNVSVRTRITVQSMKEDGLTRPWVELPPDREWQVRAWRPPSAIHCTVRERRRAARA
jgi:hypothetical protein